MINFNRFYKLITTMAKILIVDDDASLLKLLTQHLSRAEHKVTTAANGVEAMRLVDAHSFDLVITDLIMPEKDGIETITELRRKYSALKIIAMSGGGLVPPGNYLAMAALLGAIQVLAKPFSGAELLATVTGALSQSETASASRWPAVTAARSSGISSLAYNNHVV